MAKRGSAPVEQGVLFEEDYLVRTLGDLARRSDIALTELVANAWDAGASCVEITVPASRGERLTVVDDGSGLTPELFARRWMTLGYNRVRHQGSDAEFPPERKGPRRGAYGRNGIGRHGLLCFADQYEVRTTRDDRESWFVVRSASGNQPFTLAEQGSQAGTGHGTSLSVVVARNLPVADRIRQVLSSRFLHDPTFRIVVNNEALDLEHIEAVVRRDSLQMSTGQSLEVVCIEGDPRRRKHQSGVAFWVGGRLVGEPGWTVGRTVLVDGRTRIGRRLMVIVRSDDLFDQVLPDWTGFHASEVVEELESCVIAHVRAVLSDLLGAKVRETTDEVLSSYRDSIAQLEPSARFEVRHVAEAVATRHPDASPEMLAAAVEGVIDFRRTRSEQALIARIMSLSPEDIEGLHRLLDEWTVQDALTVLDEIGRRIKVVELIEKLMGQQDANELKVLHPLVTEARWLFGPEFESASYASNVSIRRAVEAVFRDRVKGVQFANPRKRPDLLLLSDATLSAVGLDQYDLDRGTATLRKLVLIELKRGASTIGRDAMHQANCYVQDLLGCGLLDGPPYVHAFVVGDKIDDRMDPVQKVGEPDRARIEAHSFGRLVRTANKRLFDMRDRVNERYGQEVDTALQTPALESRQGDLEFDTSAAGPEHRTA